MFKSRKFCLASRRCCNYSVESPYVYPHSAFLIDAETSFRTGKLIKVNYCHKIICTRHNPATSVPLSEKGEQQIYTRFVDCGCIYKFVVQLFDWKVKGHLNVAPGEVSLDLNGTKNQKRGKR